MDRGADGAITRSRRGSFAWPEGPRAVARATVGKHCRVELRNLNAAPFTFRYIPTSP